MITIIVASSKNNVIGHLNKIPWYLPRDLKHYAQKTTGHTVIMGRKTHESILNRLGHPLPNRKSVIITSQKDYLAPGCVVVPSWEEATKETVGEDIFVSGGAEIYNLALPHTDRIIHTIIDTVSDGDIFFKFDKSDWNLVSETHYPKDERNPFDSTVYEYDRKK